MEEFFVTGLDAQRDGRQAAGARLDAEALRRACQLHGGKLREAEAQAAVAALGANGAVPSPRCSTSARIGKGAWMGTRPRNRRSRARRRRRRRSRAATGRGAALRRGRPRAGARPRARAGGGARRLPARRADDGGSSRRSGPRDRCSLLSPCSVALPASTWVRHRCTAYYPPPPPVAETNLAAPEKSRGAAGQFADPPRYS